MSVILLLAKQDWLGYVTMSKIVTSVFSSIVLTLETAVLMFYCFITGRIIINAISGLIQYCCVMLTREENLSAM